MTHERRTESTGTRLFKDGLCIGWVYPLRFTGDWACILCFPEGDFDLGFTKETEAEALSAVESAANKGQSFSDWQSSRSF